MTEDELSSIAQQLVGRLREDDPEAVNRWLCSVLPSSVEWFRLCFVLAAAVPAGEDCDRLTAWTTSCMAKRHGTVTAYRQAGCRCPEVVEKIKRYRRIESARVKAQRQGLYRPKRQSRDLHVDEIAVERATHGDKVELTIRERALAVRKLTKRGMWASQIAVLLGISVRTVTRYRTGKVRTALSSPDMSRHLSRETLRETLGPDRTVA